MMLNGTELRPGDITWSTVPYDYAELPAGKGVWEWRPRKSGVDLFRLLEAPQPFDAISVIARCETITLYQGRNSKPKIESIYFNTSCSFPVIRC